MPVSGAIYVVNSSENKMVLPFSLNLFFVYSAIFKILLKNSSGVSRFLEKSNFEILHPVSSAMANVDVVLPLPFGPKKKKALGISRFLPSFSSFIFDIKYSFKIFFVSSYPAIFPIPKPFTGTKCDLLERFLFACSIVRLLCWRVASLTAAKISLLRFFNFSIRAALACCCKSPFIAAIFSN